MYCSRTFGCGRISVSSGFVEDSVGALPAGAKVPPPPGSRPEEGGGRMNHSTNLQARQPAGYGFVQQQACNSSVATLPPIIPGNEIAPTTPAATVSSTKPLSSGQVNSQALSNLNQLGSTFDSVVARLMPRESTPSTSTPSDVTYSSSSNKRKHQRKIEIAIKKKKELQDQIEFMRPMKDDTADNKIHFADISKQYIAASRDVVRLINETRVDEEE